MVKNKKITGPAFLIRAYANALRALGLKTAVKSQTKDNPKPAAPQVLHFGESYIVAAAFVAQRLDLPSKN